MLIIAAGSWIAKRQAELALFDGRLEDTNGVLTLHHSVGRQGSVTFASTQRVLRQVQSQATTPKSASNRIKGYWGR